MIWNRLLLVQIFLVAGFMRASAQDSNLFTDPDEYLKTIKTQPTESFSSCEEACELLYINPKLWGTIKSSCGNYIKRKKVSKGQYNIKSSLKDDLSLYHVYSSIRDVIVSRDEVLSAYLGKRFELNAPFDEITGKIVIYKSRALINFEKGGYLIQLVLDLKKSNKLEVGLAELIVQTRR